MSSKADHESRYQQLASDIASRIAEGSYREGDKIFARSSLASQYQVSSETARRAICVLAELGIVEAEKGSGVTVKSRENALLFISRRRDARTLSFLKNSIAEKLEKQMKEIAELKEEIEMLVDLTERFRSTNPFIPFEITMEGKFPSIGKKISDLCFWQSTSATVVAIKKKGVLILSPGASTLLEDGDVLYFVGDEGSYSRVKHFLQTLMIKDSLDY
ncbi:MAG TPA: GntR family transcriptional regulator [Synergistaceae bacterium]|jgi:K+/H+ antiporter YhaU regulatory subunit KhtT|nr:GntR family transcriptional regulator [Synergistaceae bacterium]NLL40371.1 GntR family transcriptional regulator [Synergistaceae bacterium]HPX03892.1 GntR family transcriptional regulator [Synergistaceae bacterium]HQA55045.1 GntR family transcriptional regulator [Synergistaceae bacterium]